MMLEKKEFTDITLKEYFNRKRKDVLASVTPVPPSQPIPPIGPPPTHIPTQRESTTITQNNTVSQQTRSDVIQKITSVAISLQTETSQKRHLNQEPEQENTLCIICMSEKKAILMGPCNHVDLCSRCAKSYCDFETTIKCPRCRGTVLSVAKIFS